jgi:PAS domain S-box-containing protein
VLDADAATPSERPSGSAVEPFFRTEGSDLGRNLHAVDWAATPLGPTGEWPTSLRNVVRLMLSSRFSMWMAWGPDLTFFCNDAYRRDTLGRRYPWALGRPVSEVWSEIWPDIAPRVESVVRDGRSTWDQALLLFLERSGYVEETYHTFSYSPLTDDDGDISGLFCVVSEDTMSVVSQRRMATLRDLGAELARASTEDEVFAAARNQLARDDNNLPFALAYFFDDAGTAALTWHTGMPIGHPAAPALIPTDDPSAPWPVERLAAGESVELDDLAGRFTDLPTGVWTQEPQTALAVPLLQPGHRRPYGFLVVGLNPHRPLDDDYRGFVDLIAGQVAAAVTRARAFESERRQVAQLAELDRAKTTFFTNVSHELRTPLTLLLGPAQDALDDRGAELLPAQRERLDVILRNGERLLKLVNTLLDFSRLESGRVRASFEPLDLATYTSELVSMFNSAVDRAGLTLTIDCPPLRAPVHVDREMWAKIVLNLVSNALKATFEGGITVALREVGDQAELTVHDTGVGIAAAEQERLFERFHRISGATLRTHEGSGIGLALVAELAAQHRGRVTVDSRPGEGSTFRVRLPIGTDHLPAEQVVSPASEAPDPTRYSAGYVSEAIRWVVSGDRADEVRPPVDDARRRVLVVDDNPDMRQYIGGLLRDLYRVDTAADGAIALRAARADPPDLVLTDVMMPNLDGFGLLAALRSDPTTMHVPVVMLSARSGDDATVEGLEAGADDYLVKPFTARELLARVNANLELDRVRRVAKELERSRGLLDQAEVLARVGSWQLDLATNAVEASTEYYRILGVGREAVDSLEAAFAHVDDDDRARAADAVARTVETGEPLDVEVRLIVGDDPEHRSLVRVHGVLERDEQGRPSVMRGSVQDITEQRRTEQALADARVAREAATREHAIAEELQRSLLPPPTVSSDLDVATYYRAGVEGTQVGGDWYDVIELDAGRSALVLGDVMGRGVKAAAVMGQLRATIRAYARLEMPPGEILRLLDAAVRELNDFMIVTCIYAVYDPTERTLTYANAGHLPPLLTIPGHPTRRLTTGELPLGAGASGAGVETVEVPVGARLTLYTDGLVERMGSDLDTGIDKLVACLDRTPYPAPADPAAIVDLLLPDGPDDDVAVLMATVPPQRVVPRYAVHQVDQGPNGVATAREFTGRTLAEWGYDADRVFDVTLMISEMVTNALVHGTMPIEVRLRSSSAELVVDVCDGSRRLPLLRATSPREDGGRGLHIVAALADDWGSRLTTHGKSVRAVVYAPLPPDDPN